MSDYSSDRLRDALLEDLTDRLEKGEMILDKETGEYVRVAIGGSILNAANNFLKQFPPKQPDDTEVHYKSKLLQEKASKMPFARH